MSIPNPNPNIADGIKCDNKTYSSNKIESLIKVATELPIPEEGDAGKVLAVDDELGYGLEALADVATTGAYSDLSGTPTLATVATSGSYDDLIDKPVIPTVPTIQSLSASDIFEDITNIDTSNFVAYQIGKAIFISRCRVTGGSTSGTETRYAAFKDAYKPAASVRIIWDDAGSNNFIRGFIDPTNGLIVGKADAGTNYMYNTFYLTA